MGNRYDTEDWVVFLADGKESPELRRLQKRFEDQFYKVAEKRFKNSSLGDYYEYADDPQHDAYLAFSSIVGHGIGLWEGEEPHHLMLQDSVMNDSYLGSVAELLEQEIYILEDEDE